MGSVHTVRGPVSPRRIAGDCSFAEVRALPFLHDLRRRHSSPPLPLPFPSIPQPIRASPPTWRPARCVAPAV